MRKGFLMKKVFCVICVLLLLMSSGIHAFSSESTPHIYAQQMTADKGESEIINIKISDNSGLMGLKIHLAYLSECLDVRSVSRGTVTQKGTFMDNVGLKEGGFDIIWYNTEEVKEDGTIASIYADVLSDEPFQIYISYSEKDTFNGKYENVKFECVPVCSKNFSNSQQGEDTTQQNSADEVTAESKQDDNTDVNDEMLQLLVLKTINDFGVDSLNDLSDDLQTQILDAVNKNIKEKYGIEKSYSDFQRVKDTYKSGLVSMLPGDIAALEKNKSAQEIVGDIIEQKHLDKKLDINTAGEIVENLEEKGLDKVYSNTLTDSELKNALDNIIYDRNQDNTVESDKQGKIPIVITVIVLLLVLLSIVFLIYRRKTKERRITNEK